MTTRTSTNDPTNVGTWNPTAPTFIDPPNPDPNDPRLTQYPNVARPIYATEGGAVGTTAPAQIAQMYPWLPQAAIAAYNEAYTAGAVDPWALVRQDTRYEVWFPGNKLEDGQVRHSESAYAGIIEGYELAFKDIGLNPDLFKGQFGDYIRGDVSPQELFEERLAPTYERIWDASEAIRAEYSERYGVELSFEGILASALDPEVGNMVLQGRLRDAEIAGEARESGYDISDEMLAQLAGAGFDRNAADELFQSARNVLPTLAVLARRHGDPDDEFDLNSFVSSQVFADPRERRRLRSLVASETAGFANTGIAVQRDRAGGMTGLQA